MGGCDAIHSRHIDIEQDNVRFQLNNSFDGISAVFGFAAYLEGMPIEEFADGYPRPGQVIHDKYSGGQFMLHCKSPATRIGAARVPANVYSRCGFVCSIREKP